MRRKSTLECIDTRGKTYAQRPTRRRGPSRLFAPSGACVFVVVVVLVSLATWLPKLSAGGPLIVEGGVPARWNTSVPLTLHMDRGALGAIEETQPILQHAIDAWNSVATSGIRLTIRDSARDVEGLNEREFDALITSNDGTNPVLFDSTGEIFDAIFGEGSNVLAIAGPSLTSNRRIVKGYAVFNGKGVGEEDVETFKAVVTHEIGHVLNLDHTQINGLWLEKSHPSFSGNPTRNDIATMFPVLVNSPAVRHPMATLHADDVRAVSSLYPAAGFEGTAAIRGTVFDFDGQSPLQGVNVVARSIRFPFEDAASTISGALAPEGDSAAQSGAFHLLGLTANENYVLYIEEVFRGFTEGSGIGPLDPPLDPDPTAAVAFLEFWNGTKETGIDPPDDPLDVQVLMPLAGEELRADIVFNGILARVTEVIPASGSFMLSHDVEIAGANFNETLAVNLEGPAIAPLSDLVVNDKTTLTGVVPSGLIPGTYQIRVITTKGISRPGRITFRVTEPLPLISSFSPDQVENNQARLISVSGENLLGSQSARMESPRLPNVDLEVFQRVASNRVVLEVPAGTLPGEYTVTVTNTAGTSPPSAGPLVVVELAPALSGETSPSSGRNTRETAVTVFGDNLSGTLSVDLLLEPDVVPLTILETSLNEVLVQVPAGLRPGTYVVRLTNSMMTTTGPATFTVRKGGSGGGGCGQAPPGIPAAPSGLPLLLATLGLLALTRAVGAWRRWARDRAFTTRAAGA